MVSQSFRNWITVFGMLSVLMAPLAMSQEKTEENERAAFEKVVKHLDLNGNFMMVVNTKGAIKVMDNMVNGASKHLIPLVSQGKKNDTALMIESGDKFLKSFYDNSGVRDIDACGISSVKLADDLYSTKAFISRAPDSKGRIWKILGGEPTELDCVGFLPATTAAAGFTDFDLNEVWAWQFELVQATGNPQVVGMHQMLIMQLQQFQINLAELISGTDGRHGIVLTLDEASQINFTPKAGNKITFPEPGLALFVKVKDNTIRDLIYSKLVIQGENNQKVPLPFQEKLVEGITMRTYNLPIPLQIPVQIAPTLATVDGYLVLASNANVMEQVIISKKKGTGAKQTALYKTLMAGMPTKGNSFTYATPVMAKTVQSIQKQIAANNGQGKTMEALDAFGNLFKNENTFALSITVAQADGVKMVGKTNMGVAEAFATQIGSIVSTAASMTMPKMAKAGTRASKTGDMNNLKQIGLGVLMYSGDHNGDFPTDLGQLIEGNYIQSGSVFVTPGTDAAATPKTAVDVRGGKCSYEYFGKGLRDDMKDPSKTILASTKAGKLNGWINVLFIDGHVESIQAATVEEAAQKRGWVLKK